MLDSVFRGLFDTEMTHVISVSDFLICVGGSLVIGLILAVAYMIRTRYTKSFVATLAMLPAVVCVVIMMVNGNVGTGVAVAGAFSLVRFRSVPGTAKEIGALFLAMGAGLIAGMGSLHLHSFLPSFLAVLQSSITVLLLEPGTAAGIRPFILRSRKTWITPAFLTISFLNILPPVTWLL